MGWCCVQKENGWTRPNGFRGANHGLNKGEKCWAIHPRLFLDNTDEVWIGLSFERKYSAEDEEGAKLLTVGNDGKYGGETFATGEDLASKNRFLADPIDCAVAWHVVVARS